MEKRGFFSNFHKAGIQQEFCDCGSFQFYHYNIFPYRKYNELFHFVIT